MTIDERLIYLLSLQSARLERLTKMVEEGRLALTESTAASAQTTGASARLMDVLTERTIQTMDAVNRLMRLAESHGHRIEGFEDQHPS